MTASRRRPAPRPEHFLRGDVGGAPDWLARLLAHAERIVSGAYRERSSAVREETFVGVAPRTQRRGGKDAVPGTRRL